MYHFYTSLGRLRGQRPMERIEWNKIAEIVNKGKITFIFFIVAKNELFMAFKFILVAEYFLPKKLKRKSSKCIGYTAGYVWQPGLRGSVEPSLKTTLLSNKWVEVSRTWNTQDKMLTPGGFLSHLTWVVAAGNFPTKVLSSSPPQCSFGEPVWD